MARLRSLDALRLTHSLGRGGTAEVFQVADQPFVFKRFFNPERSTPALKDLVEQFDRWSPEKRDYVRGRIAWPETLVEDRAGQVIGYLAPRAPSSFEVKLSTGSTRVATLDFLLFDRRSAMVGVEPVSDHSKIMIVLHLAETLNFLHQNGLAYSDLNSSNVLWAVDAGGPRAFVLDADSIAFVDSPSDFRAAISPLWSDPRIVSGEINHGDEASMSLGISLLLVRLLIHPLHPVAPPVAPGVQALSETLASMVSRGLDWNAQDRPTITEWVAELRLEAAQQSRSAAVDRRPRDPSTRVREASTTATIVEAYSTKLAWIRRLSLTAGLAAGAALVVRFV